VRSSWRTAAADAGSSVNALYGDEAICAQLEEVYGQVVETARR